MSLSVVRPVARTIVLMLGATPLLLAETNAANPADLGSTTAVAGAASSAAKSGPGPGSNVTFMYLIMAVGLVAMFLLANRSQKKAERESAEMRSKLKRGDQVVTVGGMHGEVATVGESTVELRLGTGDNAPVVTFSKSAVSSIAGADQAKAK
jgi:preprotein translocase subunit YajC